MRLDRTRHGTQRLDRHACGPVQSALEIDGAGSRDDIAHAVGKDGMGEEGRCAGAVTDNVAGFLRRLTKNLGAEILFWVLEIDFLGDGDAVIADDRCAPALLNQHRFRLRAQRDAHRIGKKRCAPQDLFAGGGMKQDLLVGHPLFLPQSNHHRGVRQLRRIAARPRVEKVCLRQRYSLILVKLIRVKFELAANSWVEQALESSAPSLRGEFRAVGRSFRRYYSDIGQVHIP